MERDPHDVRVGGLDLVDLGDHLRVAVVPGVPGRVAVLGARRGGRQQQRSGDEQRHRAIPGGRSPGRHGFATVMRTSSTPASTVAPLPASTAVSSTATSSPRSEAGMANVSDDHAGFRALPPLTVSAVARTWPSEGRTMRTRNRSLLPDPADMPTQ